MIFKGVREEIFHVNMVIVNYEINFDTVYLINGTLVYYLISLEQRDNRKSDLQKYV